MEEPTIAKAPTHSRLQVETLVNLHIAEYQALTTRCTYWITLQYALWPILLGMLALLANVRPFVGTQIVEWGAVVITQIVIVSFYAAMAETYNNVKYMEYELRPLVQNAVNTSQFWLYESWLAKRRPLNPAWWEWTPASLCIVALSFTACIRWPWNVGDSLGLVVNLVLTALAVSIAHRSIQIRKAISVRSEHCAQQGVQADSPASGGTVGLT